MYRAPEHSPTPEPYIGYPDIAVRADTNCTTDGSTAAIDFFYATVRVLYTATSPVLVLSSSDPLGGWVMNIVTQGNSSMAKPAYATNLANRPEETAHDSAKT